MLKMVPLLIYSIFLPGMPFPKSHFPALFFPFFSVKKRRKWKKKKILKNFFHKTVSEAEPFRHRKESMDSSYQHLLYTIPLLNTKCLPLQM